MTFRSSFGICFAILTTCAVACGEAPRLPDLSKYAKSIAGWEDEVSRLEAKDAVNPDPEDAVLLIGSSSIRLWKTAAEDLAPYPVIERGYGGASFADLAHYAERIVSPHRYRAAVVFCANDVTGGAGDRSPEEVAEWFGYVADVLRRHEPDAPVICCDVRPTPSRHHVWDKTKAVNAALKAECDKRAGVYYLDTADEYLLDNGDARSDVYRADRLHLNDAGYELWSSQIKAELDRVLGEESSAKMPVYSDEDAIPEPASEDAVEALHSGTNQSKVEADRAGKPLRVLLVAGPKDHDAGEHDYPSWLDVWSQLLPRSPGVEVDSAWEFPTAEQADGADVMVFYQRGRWDDERAAVIDPFLDRGGGLVYIHWAVDGRGGEQAMAERIGLSAKGGGGIKYRHGELDLDFTPGAGHPVARNLHRARWTDESYWALTGDPSRLTLLGAGVEDGAPQPLFWTMEHASGGRVFVSIPGHYMWTFDDPVYRTLLLRGVAWAGHRNVDRFNEVAMLGARVAE
ncbi:ThuA domain-containing protein [Botrimarina mediterranea]|uniref:Trehalose utilization n=1 Tax=Botrimarina mediterranea TaxID=2528022 RepID=A0A518KB04_9BACT|nr:ThuA domain-containing protein [Botrimarina mediterranea]QDV74974.1 Trehalose utilization [Botrimarina mediterranea]QDV79619.1 Trehalose utilization [Planctomycetes bacterium K2D]